MRVLEENVSSVRNFFRSQKSSIVNHKNIVSRISKKTGLDPVTVCSCLRKLEKNGEIRCEVWGPHGPLARVMSEISPLPVPEDQAKWQSYLNSRYDLSPDCRIALMGIWTSIIDWPEEAYSALVDDLIHFRDARTSESGYLKSASGRLASSKLLSSLPRSSLVEFGINQELLSANPICFLVSGHSDPEAVVLVENPNAFERALSACEHLPVAWISTYGFGATALDSGQKLVEGISAAQNSNEILPDLTNPSSSSSVTTAIRSGSPPPIAQLLSHPNLLYWGDLDVAGLMIFDRVRSKLPHLMLSGLYKPMVDLLRSGGGHPYVNATGKPRQCSSWNSSDKILSNLCALCRTRAVDQEFVSRDDIRRLATNKLTIEET